MRRILLAFVLLPSAFVLAFAKNRSGITAVPSLELPTGARAAVLGPGYAAAADDLYSLQYNPAGLSQLRRREASFLYLKGVEDTALEFAGYGQPLRFPGLLNAGFPVAAAGVLYSQNGTIEVNRTNPDGSFLDSRRLIAGSDLLVSGGYAERLGEQRLAGGANVELFAGLSVGYLRSTLAEKYNADGVAANGGVLCRLSDPELSLGLSVANFGPPLRYVSEYDPLPLTYRGALGYTLATLFDHRFLFTAGAEYAVEPAQTRPALALEWTAHREFSLRAGYLFRHDDQLGFSAGLGVTERNFALDYAWVPFDTLADQHRIALTYRFGEAAQAAAPRRAIKDIDRPVREPRPTAPVKEPAPVAPSLIVPGWE